MAVLPSGDTALSGGVVFKNYPTNTFYADSRTRHIIGMADGYKAIKQAVEIIVNCERFHWQIYSTNFGVQWKGLIGNDSDFIAADLQKRLNDAFSADERITGVSNFKYEMHGDVFSAEFTVDTVYGGVIQKVEVNAV